MGANRWRNDLARETVKVPHGRHEARALAQDAIGAVYRGVSAARQNFMERRRLRGESPQFTAAFGRASFIGGWLARSEAELLFELAGSVPTGQDVVEIGSYLGRSTAFLALGAGPGRTVHAVDPFSSGHLQLVKGEPMDTSKQFTRNMDEIGVLDRVEMHVARSVEAARSYRGRPVGLLFIDANHSERAVYEDGSEWSSHLAPECIVAFDDISWDGVTKGVRRLVAEGTLSAIAGRVGRIGLCGPEEQWPRRVRAIASPAESGGAGRTLMRRFLPLPPPGANLLGHEGS